MSELSGEAIDRALAEGRTKDAADLLARAGRPAEAAARYAEIWSFAEAVHAALLAEQPVVALGYALDANDTALVFEAVQSCERAATASRAADFARDRRRPRVAAQLYEAAGDAASAAQCYEQAGDFHRAAACMESAGDAREAGRLYERSLREDATDVASALALARILCRFGRFEPAVRVLQAMPSSQDAQTAVPGQRLLVACLDAMGAPEAAAEALALLRRIDSSAPARVADLLTQVWGSPAGLRGEGDDAAAALLGGRYRVVRELGEGASGRVLLADDVLYARQVAVKVLRLDGGIGGRDALARFLREARVAVTIDDPHVVRVYEADPTGPFLVMEYMSGGTLEERLRRAELNTRTLSARELSVFLDALLAGLEAIHRRGIVHRDLKPQNVFFGAAGELKIGDFGVAHLADSGATATGAMLGTLAYMAPEQVALSDNPTAATDLYAFGVMLYRMLTGALPFSGADIAVAKLDRPAPLPSQTCAALGDSFDAALASLLARDPSARPQSCEDVRVLLAPLTFPTDGVFVSATDKEPAARAPLSQPPSEAQRYLPVEGAEGLALDKLLGRRVFLRSLSPTAAERLKAFARADHPNLQAVYLVDEAAGRVVLEAPAGESVASAERARGGSGLMDALRRLHEEGIVHGAVDADHVLAAPGRLVLLIHELDVETTMADDCAALAALFGDVSPIRGA